MTPRITTYTGKSVNPLALKGEDIDIRDIAHSLACINRFNGHPQAPISVAQHSWYVSRLAERETKSRLVGLQGLLHDASEAYLGDVTKWLKMTPEFAAYRTAEERAQSIIYRVFGCREQEHLSVTGADVLMVRFEGTKGYNGFWASGHPKYGPVTDEEARMVGPWYPWSWDVAEQTFLARYAELTR